MITTRPQRQALLRVYRRIVAYPSNLTQQEYMAFTYRKFRRTVRPGPGCIMVPFAGMWLGVEVDGYVHS